MVGWINRKIKNKDKEILIKQETRLHLLLETIKKELVEEYDTFIVKIIQLYYNDDYETYQSIKEENITKKYVFNLYISLKLHTLLLYFYFFLLFKEIKLI